MLTKEEAQDVFGNSPLDFSRAFLQGATLQEAQLQGAHLTDAQLQDAHFGHAQLQGADFEDAQLQGAHLMGAQLQGADFEDAQLQGAHFGHAQLQGAYAHENSSDKTFFERGKAQIEHRTGKDTEVYSAIFSGGITQEQYKKMNWEAVQWWWPRGRDDFLRKLEPHVDQPADNSLPENVITGVLTHEMAAEIIEKSGL